MSRAESCHAHSHHLRLQRACQPYQDGCYYRSEFQEAKQPFVRACCAPYAFGRLRQSVDCTKEDEQTGDVKYDEERLGIRVPFPDECRPFLFGVPNCRFRGVGRVGANKTRWSSGGFGVLYVISKSNEDDRQNDKEYEEGGAL